MSTLTFSNFVAIVEDANDAAGIQAQIAQLDVKLAQVSAPILAQKNQLLKRLQISQKQAQQSGQQQQQAMPNTTTTPGSTGAATPGASPPLA